MKVHLLENELHIHGTSLIKFKPQIISVRFFLILSSYLTQRHAVSLISFSSNIQGFLNITCVVLDSLTLCVRAR